MGGPLTKYPAATFRTLRSYASRRSCCSVRRPSTLPSARCPFQRTRPSVAARTGDPRRPCFQSANVRRLEALPTGLVTADLDLGPYIVALTPHRVVPPYHRLSEGILANHAILEGTLDGARRACSPRRRLRGPVHGPPPSRLERSNDPT